MRLIYTYLLLLLISPKALDTDQQPDVIYLEGKKHTLDIGWGHPSPLEVYYQQNNLAYPFVMLSTANYRGHVATWVLKDGRMYLKEVEVHKKVFPPRSFEITSKITELSKDGMVFADWFSGMLICRERSEKNHWKIKNTLYIYVKNGLVQQSEVINNEDVEAIQKMTAKDTSNVSLMEKYSMLYLNQSYISYYFRLGDEETIRLNEKEGFIKGKGGHSIVLEQFGTDPLDWPYNWENHTKTGAPNGVWELHDGKLYLTALNLHTGLSFDSPEVIPLDLTDLFYDAVGEFGVFANWTQGIYRVVHGEEKASEWAPSLKDFVVTEYTFLRIDKGVVLEQYTFLKDFDPEDPPEGTDEKKLRLLEDFKNQNK